ncbi:hypothetical protein PTSG_07344 [Salpingoeca rosetta]|uniref:Armadillo-like helical domain-containing protein n=1 Tax=Salpingoeca rosetta (strain ATCC 50818 / BSB-021) TaxID=946362 RepID=F2UJ54_SALR5|nr:uncharacterized protein PTSG_07344 [Salpingoeca rosetta]EGD77002.1 hypothetical protein PTSG_07344 [Salpingoeca rosetta]|eukprot:XP_004990842.1 hypothetical protein PTSG_07344 [Salpingoeca rosetta]
MRHRPATTVTAMRAPLVLGIFDLCIEYMVSHMSRSFDVDAYTRCLEVVHRLLCYQKTHLVRLNYEWANLWSALSALFKFVIQKTTLSTPTTCLIREALASTRQDKKAGVIGLCMFELRRLGHIGDIALVGTNGTKFPGIRKHLKENISDVYNGLDVSVTTFPNDDVQRDVEAYKRALDGLRPGDVTTIFTPDPTHFEIAKYAIERGVHVLVTKPAVMTLEHHHQLVALARKHNVLVMVEFHKRWDPIYVDARNRARALGDFSYFNSFMSQPKYQLETFKAWAGKTSDISYYLNSHHIDMHAWMVEGRAVPTRVVASAATGVAESHPYNCPQASTRLSQPLRRSTTGEATVADFDKTLPTLASTVATTAVLQAGRLSLDHACPVDIAHDQDTNTFSLALATNEEE